jgi:hypothetical protein
MKTIERPWLSQIASWFSARMKSPGELRVYDSLGRVTGLINGEVKEDIPNSVYDGENNMVVIFSSSIYPSELSFYRSEVVGTSEGNYGLEITSANDREATTFTAENIPILPKAVNQYSINWTALSQGEEGVTVMVDSDGDGVFERIFTSDSALSQDEFVLAAIKFYAVWEDIRYPVLVSSNSTISNFTFNQPQKQISFNITGLSGAKGYCNVTIPKSLLKGEPWSVKLNGTDWAFTLTENETNSFIYFTYTHASIYEVTIQGTWVIPEFPSAMILTLLTLTTLIATVLLKKKRKTKPQLP